jgi:UDP-N-acetyl-2-amino-2-deoxyglucuronate dehydrogenase
LSRSLRIGVVGVGAMGQAHVDVWRNVAGARVTAVCDSAPDRVNTVAEKYGARPFTNVAAMAASDEIDAVDICTPSGLHADQALAAAEHGAHVLVEKPLDLDLAKADRLIELCDRKGLTLGCIFQRRTYAGVQAVAKAIHEGRMGRLLSCSAYVKWWRTQEYYDSAGWRGTRALDGGVLANQAIHAIDQLVWYAGPVAEVEYARLETVAHRMEAEDSAIAVVRFESGARGVIEATTCCSPDLCSRVEVYGTRGSAAFSDANVTKFGLDGEDMLASIPQEEGTLGGGSVPMAISLRGHLVQFQDFVEAVRTSRDPMVSGREARKSLDALRKIYEKAESQNGL